MPKHEKFLTAYFLSHQHQSLRYELKFKYYITLEAVLEKLDRQYYKPAELQAPLKEVYNQFGQAVPLDFCFHQNNMELYIDKPGTHVSEPTYSEELNARNDSEGMEVPVAVKTSRDIKTNTRIKETCLLYDSD